MNAFQIISEQISSVYYFIISVKYPVFNVSYSLIISGSDVLDVTMIDTRSAFNLGRHSIVDNVSLIICTISLAIVIFFLFIFTKLRIFNKLCLTMRHNHRNRWISLKRQSGNRIFMIFDLNSRKF